MGIFAAQTYVSAESSRAEIEKTLRRFGATGFMYGWQDDRALVAFEMNDRRIKFVVPMPNQDDPKFHQTPTGRRKRNPEAFHVAYEQATRQTWRALALAIKGKLVSVQDHIETFEEAFLPHFVMPNGKTVAELILPQLDQAYMTGKLPKLLGE